MQRKVNPNQTEMILKKSVRFRICQKLSDSDNIRIQILTNSYS